MTDRYDELYRSWRWDVPERFNIARACCGRWASDRSRFALYWEDESGAASAWSFWDIQKDANRLSNALAALGVRAGAVQRGAESITEADVARRIGVMAHDSMGGRATGSPGLKKTAQYIADEFRRFGLKPGGDSGTYLQTYAISRRTVLAARSTASFGEMGGTAGVNTTLAEGATWLGGATSASVRGGVVMVGGASLTPGGLVRLVMKDDKVAQEERYLGDLRERIRDVRQAPDGSLYLLTDARNGQLLRITPAAKR